MTKTINSEFTFFPKSKIKASLGRDIGKYPFFTSSDIKVLHLDTYDYDDEAVIIGTGGKPSCNYINGKFSFSTDNIVLKSKGKYLTKFLYYMLRYNNLEILNHGFRGSGLKHISKKYFSSIELPDVELIEQEEIVSFCDKCNAIIKQKESQIKLLDELIKSRFIEMFGDVLDNDKGFESCAFGDFVNQMNIGPFGSDLKNDCFVSKEDGYCMVYEQKHAIDKDMSVEPRYVSKAKYEKMRRFDIGPGDIIVSCRGTIGQCFILPKDAPHGIIHPSLMMIKPKDTVNHKFLLFLLERILAEQNEQGSGVKMAIKATELAKIVTIKPSIKLQNSFINFVEQIDKSKFIMHKQIKLLQELLDKKMEEYFG